MPALLVIDNDLLSRGAVRRAAPPDWSVFEAVNGLSGLDAVRQHGTMLNLIVIDPHLPDLDGRLVCAQIRTLLPTVQILPIARTADPLPFLIELGCLPALMKPATSEDLAQQVRRAVAEASPPPVRSAMLHLLYQQAVVAEQRARQESRPLRVMVYASSPITRAGLSQLLGPVAAIDEAAQPGALRDTLARAQYHAVIVDASDGDVAVEIAHACNLPVVLIASTATPRLSTQLEHVVGVVLENDPGAADRLCSILEGIAAGEPYVALPFELHGRAAPIWIVPPTIARRFATIPITPRELEVLWLDAQGWSSDQIAQHLTIERATVNSHWKRVQRKLNRTRQEVRALVRQRLASDVGSCDLDLAGDTPLQEACVS